jgi:hypothetical protein
MYFFLDFHYLKNCLGIKLVLDFIERINQFNYLQRVINDGTQIES